MTYLTQAIDWNRPQGPESGVESETPAVSRYDYFQPIPWWRRQIIFAFRLLRFGRGLSGARTPGMQGPSVLSRR